MEAMVYSKSQVTKTPMLVGHGAEFLGVRFHVALPSVLSLRNMSEKQILVWASRLISTCSWWVLQTCFIAIGMFRWSIKTERKGNWSNLHAYYVPCTYTYFDLISYKALLKTHFYFILQESEGPRGEKNSLKKRTVNGGNRAKSIWETDKDPEKQSHFSCL